MDTHAGRDTGILEETECLAAAVVQLVDGGNRLPDSHSGASTPHRLCMCIWAMASRTLAWWRDRSIYSSRCGYNEMEVTQSFRGAAETGKNTLTDLPVSRARSRPSPQL